ARIYRSLGLLIGTTLDVTRRGGHILADTAELQAHLYDQIALLQPLASWSIAIGSEATTTLTFSHGLIANVNRFLASGANFYRYERPGYAAWRGRPRHYAPNAGSSITLLPEDHILPDPTPNDFVDPKSVALTFLIPVGFRCAR